MKSVAISAMMKALTGTSRPAATGRSGTLVTIASAAPKLAAAEMPSVKGLASGLARIVCICAPATESEAPTTIAITATGMRMSQTTAAPDPKRRRGREERQTT